MLTLSGHEKRTNDGEDVRKSHNFPVAWLLAHER